MRNLFLLIVSYLLYMSWKPSFALVLLAVTAICYGGGGICLIFNLTIEDDVWIGDSVIILGKVRRIGKGAVIGAGSVVTKDVPEYSVVAGNPVRFIRKRE